MANVKSVIFFGKSVKNIWNLDFFKYNHKYETVKQRNRLNSYIRATVKTWNRITEQQLNSHNSTADKYLEQYHSRNSHNRYNSYYRTTVSQSNRATA